MLRFVILSLPPVYVVTLIPMAEMRPRGKQSRSDRRMVISGNRAIGRDIETISI